MACNTIINVYITDVHKRSAVCDYLPKREESNGNVNNSQQSWFFSGYHENMSPRLSFALLTHEEENSQLIFNSLTMLLDNYLSNSSHV